MSHRILIAEDEPNIVLSLEFLLKGAGYEVTVAGDGSEAIKLAGAMFPNLVVLDLMLPKLDGFEVCRWLRSNPGTRDTKIVMLTARGRESEMEKGLAAGANVYMTNPFATRELMGAVAGLLGTAPPSG